MKKLLIISLFLLPVVAKAQNFSELKWLTEEYPPYNYTKNGELKGSSSDVVAAIVKKEIPNLLSKVKVLPWARAYGRALKEKGVVLYSTTHTDARDKLFKWVGPVNTAVIAIIAKKDSKVVINNKKDLGKYVYGVVRDDVGDQLIVAEGVGSLERTSSLETNIKKLRAGRIDAIVYDNAVAMWKIRDLGFNPADFKVVYTLLEKPLSIAFQKDTDDKIVNTLQKRLDALKASGEYDKIIAKYK